jgi:hypothetical protein
MRARKMEEGKEITYRIQALGIKKLFGSWEEV